MLQKKKLKIYSVIFFSPVLKLNTFKTIPQTPQTYSLTKSLSDKLGNTGKFFKKLAFVGLALSCVTAKHFYSLKIKSVIFVLWNTIAAYTFIF